MTHKSDPFAPATSPSHAKNRGEDNVAWQDDFERGQLLGLHQTEHERRFVKVPDAGELERRDQLVQEFREELEEHGEAANPTLIDLVGEEYVWQGGDDEPAPHWAHHAEVEEDQPAEQDSGDEEPPRPAKPARKPRKSRRKAPQLDEALRALDENK